MKANNTYMQHSATHAFSNIVIDYLAQDGKLEAFYGLFPSTENFAKQIAAKQAQKIDRQALVQGLQAQYEGIALSQAVSSNLLLLAQENTFAICSAHQPIIFTGPLYVVYKILHSIKLAQWCSQHFPDHNFVPVFYVGAEDADLDEIGTVEIDSKKYKWNTAQTGACGRMHTQELITMAAEIETALIAAGFEAEQLQLLCMMGDVYAQAKNLSHATLQILNNIFGQYGLLILQPDAACWKKQMVELYASELKHSIADRLVQETSAALNVHYKAQAHSREINLFYLSNTSRERIEQRDGKYYILNTDIVFTEQEILECLHNYPARFSPNVILRGITQETILPNIAFIGGGGELAYWLQLKKVFEHYNVPFPILILRQSVHIVNESLAQKMKILGMQPHEQFEQLPVLQAKLVNKEFELNNFEAIKNAHQQLFESYNEILAQLPPQYTESAKGHRVESEKLQARLQQKIVAQLKKQLPEEMQMLDVIVQAARPNTSLQERTENILPLVAQYGNEFFGYLLKAFTVFGNEFLVVHYAAE